MQGNKWTEHTYNPSGDDMFDIRKAGNILEFRPRSEKDTLFAGMRIDNLAVETDKWFSLGQRGDYFLKLIESSSEVTYEETK